MPNWIAEAVESASKRREDGLAAQKGCPTEAALMSEPSIEGKLAGVIASQFVHSEMSTLRDLDLRNTNMNATDNNKNHQEEEEEANIGDAEWEMHEDSVPWEGARVLLKVHGHVRRWRWDEHLSTGALLHENSSSGMLVKFEAHAMGMFSQHSVLVHLSVAGDCDSQSPATSEVDTSSGEATVGIAANVNRPHACSQLRCVVSVSVHGSVPIPVAQLVVPAGRFLLRPSPGICSTKAFYLLWHSAPHALVLTAVGGSSACASLLAGMGHVAGSPMQGSESGLLCVAQGGILAAIVTVMENAPSGGDEEVYRLELRCSAEEPIEQASTNDEHAYELLNSISNGQLKPLLTKQKSAGAHNTALRRSVEADWMVQSALYSLQIHIPE